MVILCICLSVAADAMFGAMHGRGSHFLCCFRTASIGAAGSLRLRSLRLRSGPSAGPSAVMANYFFGFFRAASMGAAGSVIR